MPILSLEKVSAGYGPIRVLQDISLHVEDGEIVTLIGANGAGKSTTLRAISRLVPISAGVVLYKGKPLIGTPDSVARLGIAHVPEGRAIFGNLTVKENLLLATFANAGRAPAGSRMNSIFDLFHVLGERRDQLASTLSGGEQQMLAIGRALMTEGDLLILDEPSMGLSPLLVKNVFSIVSEINRKGKTVLLVEQNAAMALQYSKRAYVLENGRIVAQGTSAELAHNTDLKKAYLG